MRMLLFRTLSFEHYLYALSKIYFISYNLGFLKNNPLYKYHYFLRNIIKEQEIIIDIGANLGYFSIYFSKWIGPQGVVYAVEPVEKVRKVLLRNVLNKSNIKVLPYALGENNKDIEIINTSRQAKGYIASGSNFVTDGSLPENDINVDRFNAVMRKGSELFSALPKIDFIKCDVEGYETHIIPEMEVLLKKHNPLMLIETRREKRVFMVEYLRGLGYRGFVLEKEKLFPVDQITEKQEDDILFIPESKISAYANFLA